jgi:ABC-type amino acid transport system permease subunit
MAVIASDRGRSAARGFFIARRCGRRSSDHHVVALVALFCILIPTANLKRQNIASGFGFIDRTAGFDVPSI